MLTPAWSNFSRLTKVCVVSFASFLRYQDSEQPDCLEHG